MALPLASPPTNRVIIPARANFLGSLAVPPAILRGAATHVMKFEKKGSATVGIAVFVAVLMVVGAFIWSSMEPKLSAEPTLPSVATSSMAASASLAAIDTDKDDLKDWEEALWGTDPKKTDSDNDGTDDGKEVSAQRNPTKAGPNDTVVFPLKDETDSIEPLTLTDEVSRKVFAEYWQAKVSGGDVFDMNSSGSVIMNALSEVKTPKARAYTEGEITVIADSSEIALRTYAEAVGKAIKENSVQNENELSILEDALSKKDAEQLAKLDPTLASYRAIIDAILAVPTPRETLTLHLSLVNALSTTLTTIETFRNALTDPVAALIGINQYLAVAKSLKSSFEGAASWYENKGIRFDSTSDAQYFVGLFK